ncbi:MAG: TetR/AcrR family transcriptional regulator [Chloroflexi bacterium]|nr:TetR/AcrR family transcriptional regulator [Chloroflexota bacterium]
MPRTVNPHAHRLRRDAFLDAAQRLIQTKGYEAMSIQDMLDALNTSRGALYHYFDSKQALLEGVVQRFGDGAIAALRPLLDDPDLPAPRKLERMFAGFAEWKAEQKDLTLALVKVWQSDGNAIVRDKLSRYTAERLRPILERLIRGGIDEGAFRASSAEGAATIVLALLQGIQDVMVRQFVARQAGDIPFETVQTTVKAVGEAIERLLGAEPGSLNLPMSDDAVLRFWFG